MYYRYIKVNSNTTNKCNYFSWLFGGVMGKEEIAGKTGKTEAKQGCVYSVVFTTAEQDTTFEVYLLKGKPKTPEEVSADIQKAKDWLDSIERF
jgi:hypothetical protein